MKVEKAIHLLQHIDKVDPPPFLYTKVDVRINALSSDGPSRSYVLASAVALLLVLALNTFMYVGQMKNTVQVEVSVATTAAGMGLNASNQIYHE